MLSVLAEATEALAAAVSRDLAGWVVSCVQRRVGPDAPEFVWAQAEAAGERAASEAADAIRDLQGRTPLEVLRAAVVYPTQILRDAGVPGVVRDDYARERFPDDDYDLTPTSFADVSEAVGEAGLAWGAAKVMDHKARHQ